MPLKALVLIMTQIIFQKCILTTKENERENLKNNK